MTLSPALRDWMPRITPQTADAIFFALRTWLSSMAALYTAYALQLDAPFWAWVTVWIVSQPSAGMSLSKGLFRAIGTIAGALIAVVLIALFAQTPELFVLALAVIVAACTVASNLLTNFRAYATVLTGYTAGIVASDAINNPGEVWSIALARASCILIGIGWVMVATSLFAPHRSDALVRSKFITLLKEAAQRAVYSFRGDNEERIRIGRQLIVDAIALDTQVEFAAAESAAFRLQKNRARSVLAHVFGMISARRSLDALLAREGWPRHEALELFHEVIIDFLHEIPAQLDRGDVAEVIAGLEDVRGQLARLEPERDTASGRELISGRYVIDRLDDLLVKLGDALRDWRSIDRRQVEDDPPVVLNFHRDLRAAWINGLRAFLAIVATGAFWIGSAWSHGPAALVFTSILLSLFSSVPRPDRVGWAFFRASVPAAIIGLLMKFFLLPSGSGFEFLTLTTGLVLFPLGLVMANPKTNQAAVAFSLIFLNIVAPTNPMTYDLADSLNTTLATELGVLFGTLAYVVVFPPDARAARRYVTYRIRRGLGMMAKLNPIPTFPEWETRMYDRVTRLNDPQNPSGTPGDAWLDAGLSALTLGNELLRLRQWLAQNALPAEIAAPVRRVVAAFADFLEHPLDAARVVREVLGQIDALDPGRENPQRREWARASGSLQEINSFLSRIPTS